jgi:hypothetical protein
LQVSTWARFALPTLRSLIAKAQDKPSEDQPQEAYVVKLRSLRDLTVPCGNAEILWVGADKASVYVTLKSAPHCRAALVLQDRSNPASTRVVDVAPAGGESYPQVRVPGTQLLVCSTVGQAGGGNCSCAVTTVYPNLPDSVGIVHVTNIDPRKPVIDPPANTTVTYGTPVKLSCGKKFHLFHGTGNSYVTVVYKGTSACNAKVTSSLNGEAGAEDSTDSNEHAHTFGPVTDLEVSCDGAGGGGTCEFTVTEVARLP